MSTQVNKTNKTWLEKALALLNISEQDKLVLMKKRMEKYYKEEERKCNAHIERLERELEDYLETSAEKLEEIKEQEGGRKMSEILSGLIWLGAKITAQEKEDIADE